MRFHLRRPVRAASRRRLLAAAAASLIALLAVGAALASTPVTNGYRDHLYGGGAARPTGDKPQSKLWFTDGSWFAGMFLYTTASPPKSENRIYRLDKATHSWNVTPTVVDNRDTSRADYLWNESLQTLWVASVGPQNTSAGFPVALDDAIKVFKYTYNAPGNTYTAVSTVEIPGTETVVGSFGGGAQTVTIDRDSTGRLWAAWPKGPDVMYSYSTDAGATWSAAAHVPIQTNPIRAGNEISNDSVSVVAYGANVGIAWSDHDALPTAADDGFYFAHIAAGGDPTVLANWNLQELPTLVVGNEMADNHVNIKATSDGSLYMVGKTGKDTALCATNKNLPLVELFKRTPAGTWSAHLVGTVGDCNTRPQVVISEQLDVAYVFMTAPNGGGSIYMKSAPLTGPEALKFRAPADQLVQPGTPFIRSATETLIDDPSTSKHPVTAASGIVVIANNLTKAGTPNAKYFLHNEMSIAATDSTDPAGTVSIDGGDAATNVQAVVVSVPATDAGSGMSLVRVSNSAATSGGILTTGTTYNYNTPIAWTLTAGEGVKTVYVQWRDAAGNWSAVATDTILVDTTAPTAPTAPVHKLSNPVTAKINVRLTWSGGTDSGSGLAGYVLSQQVDGGAWTILGYPATGTADVMIDSSKNYKFRVASRDHAGNVGAYVSGTGLRAANYSEAAAQITYTGTWGTQSLTTYMGGAAKYSTTTSSTATLSFTGNQVAWLSRKSSAHGVANVYIDGAYAGSVNLYSATTLYKQVVFTRTFPTVGAHTLRVVVVGTAGHPRVTVDQFFVLR